jgi:hypothetical protein
MPGSLANGHLGPRVRRRTRTAVPPPAALAAVRRRRRNTGHSVPRLPFRLCGCGLHGYTQSLYLDRQDYTSR